MAILHILSGGLIVKARLSGSNYTSKLIRESKT
jgi:hypothetical protein